MHTLVVDDKLWIYDLRTNKYFTLKTSTLDYEDLTDLVQRYNPGNRFDRKETERFRSFSYDELTDALGVTHSLF